MADLRFKLLEHPSDIGIVVFGKNPKEIFENAGFGLFSLIGDLSNVESAERFIIKVEGDDQEALLINWLNELLFYYDTKSVLIKEFKINKLSNLQLEAEIRGEKIDLDKHTVYKSVKAATYNQLQIGKNQATIVFDV
jgi:SHS2 domain-containing protein